MVWDWLPQYMPLLIKGLWITISLLVFSCLLGMAFAVPLGLVQALDTRYLARPARAFCTFIRGTPLLVQIWLLYFGLGSIFPMIPGIRQSFLWPVLREGYFYALLALTISFAGYEGQGMRHVALAGVAANLVPAGGPAGTTDARRRDRAATQGDATCGDGHGSRFIRCFKQNPPGHFPCLRTAATGAGGLCGLIFFHHMGVPLVRKPHTAEKIGSAACPSPNREKET